MTIRSRCSTLAAVIVCTSAAAYGWGNAAHVYIADHLGAKYSIQNTYELYGAMLPDIYAYGFDTMSLFLYDQLHNHGGTIMADASTVNQKSVGFGFLCHNHLYGADANAHLSGMTSPGTGYMVAKGAALAPALIPTLVTILMDAGADEPTAAYIATLAAPELGHDLCETAVDLLIKREMDKLIGAKIYIAAAVRPAGTPGLLCAVFAPSLAGYPGMDLALATAKLTTDEAAYRTMIMQYGTLFFLPEKMAISRLADQMAPLAESFIEGNILIPLDITITPAQVEGFIRKAMVLVASDFKKELKATIAAVDERLNTAGITNADPSFVFWKEGSEQAGLPAAGVPTEFALAGNYPNPFNPATTITYAVAETRRVRLSVYDMMGRESAVLVDEVREPGTYTVSWNARMFPSGVYFCRMTAGSFVQTTRMMLQK